MAPPAAGPLIHGSTTPMANDTATAASTASPPSASTAAPTSAARRCAAATTPPLVGITVLRTICVREKLSMAGGRVGRLRGVVAREADDVAVCREPDAAACFSVADQLLQHPDARAVAGHVRVHGDLEYTAFLPGHVELAAEDVEHVRRAHVRAQAGEAVHVVIHRVVADPFDRQLDHAGRLPVEEKLVTVVVRHHRAIVLKPHVARDRERVRTEVP